MDTQNTIDRKGLSVKDLVTTGIFSALMLVFTMAGGMFFAANPILTFYMPMGCALLCGPVYLLLVAKVHKRWSITVLGVIVGFFFFVTGMHWSMALGNAGMGIIADITAGFGNYKNKKLNALSYMLFMLSNTFTYLIFFIDREVYDYADAETADQDAFRIWFETMLAEGIYLAPSQFETLFMSGAHTEKDIDRTITAAEKGFAAVKEHRA